MHRDRALFDVVSLRELRKLNMGLVQHRALSHQHATAGKADLLGRRMPAPAGDSRAVTVTPAGVRSIGMDHLPARGDLPSPTRVHGMVKSAPKASRDGTGSVQGGRGHVSPARGCSLNRCTAHQLLGVYWCRLTLNDDSSRSSATSAGMSTAVGATPSSSPPMTVPAMDQAAIAMTNRLLRVGPGRTGSACSGRTRRASSAAAPSSPRSGTAGRTRLGSVGGGTAVDMQAAKQSPPTFR